jgi:beta-galactosidase
VDVASARSDRIKQEVVTADGFLPRATYPAETWIELLEPQAEVEVLATYGRDYCVGAAAVTRHRIGAGQVITLGTILGNVGQGDLVDWLLAEAGIQTPVRATSGIEVLVRSAPDRKVYILLNHSDETRNVRVRASMRDALAGTAASGQVQVPERGVRVLVAEQAATGKHIIDPY